MADVEPGPGEEEAPAPGEPWRRRFDALRRLVAAELLLLVVPFALVAAVWGFAEVADEVTEGETQRLDEVVLRLVRDPDRPDRPRGPPWVGKVARDVTALGSAVVLGLVSLATTSGVDRLLSGTSEAERRAGLDTILARPDAAARLELALPDLLREPDEPVLAALVAGLAPRAAEPTARRVLELLARRPGPTRPAALSALRGQASPPASGTRAPSVSEGSPAPASVSEAPPSATRAPSVSEGSPAAADAPSRELPWSAPFDAALADPTPDRLARAALALVDLEGAPPAGADADAVADLAGRLAIAALDHDGEVQQGLARLARGLKGLRPR